ncbi:unnamed protein product [Linum trigynum]|uniref:Uncharacterized protein n=1 Tax=Linum trigynum TaxID=586398 RepID=A0AAV2FDT3_9ROSI
MSIFVHSDTTGFKVIIGGVFAAYFSNLNPPCPLLTNFRTYLVSIPIDVVYHPLSSSPKERRFSDCPNTINFKTNTVDISAASLSNFVIHIVVVPMLYCPLQLPQRMLIAPFVQTQVDTCPSHLCVSKV